MLAELEGNRAVQELPDFPVRAGATDSSFTVRDVPCCLLAVRLELESADTHIWTILPKLMAAPPFSSDSGMSELLHEAIAYLGGQAQKASCTVMNLGKCPLYQHHVQEVEDKPWQRLAIFLPKTLAVLRLIIRSENLCLCE